MHLRPRAVSAKMGAGRLPPLDQGGHSKPMRQGLVIFAAVAPAAGSAAAETLRSTVAAAMSLEGVSTYLAYGDPAASQALRKLIGGPPPRFFPQAARPAMGERMAQAFAFLFVQDFERVLLVQPGDDRAPEPARLSAMFQAIDDEPVAIDTDGGAVLVALRRTDFPTVAAIFEGEVSWERPGAKETAQRVLAEAQKG